MLNPYKILGAAANLFFLILFTIYLGIDSLENPLFSPEIIMAGSILLYGIAVSALIVCLGNESEKLRRNGLYGSVSSMLIFSYIMLARLTPAFQQGVMLLSVWSAVNILALGFGEENRISLKEQKRLAEQKRKLDRLRGKNPNESDKSAS